MTREGKAPSFPFYAADWIADGDILDMTLAQEGAYVRLLAYQWRDGSIPADESSICKRLRINADEFAAVWPTVSKKFGAASEPGRLANDRLEKERARMLEVREERKRAANARWGNANASVLQSSAVAVASSSAGTKSTPSRAWAEAWSKSGLSGLPGADIGQLASDGDSLKLDPLKACQAYLAITGKWRSRGVVVVVTAEKMRQHLSLVQQVMNGEVKLDDLGGTTKQSKPAESPAPYHQPFKRPASE